MATQLQLRRGTTAENDVFTGAVGELTMDTDTNGIRIHDGNTTGGFDVPVLVAVQRPTADNNYTWYRKYSDGWVEQGGTTSFPAAGTSSVTKTINLIVPMANNKYAVNPCPFWSAPSAYYGWQISNKTTSSVTFTGYSATDNNNVVWQVSGMGA